MWPSPATSLFSAALDGHFALAKTPLSSGWEKEVYPIVGRPDLMARVLRPVSLRTGQLAWDSARLERLVSEYTAAQRLIQEWDVPALIPHRTGFFGSGIRSAPADICDAYAASFKDEPTLIKSGRTARARLIAVLRPDRVTQGIERIQRAFDGGLILGDFQLLIRPRSTPADEIRVFDSHLVKGAVSNASAWRRTQQARLDSFKRLVDIAAKPTWLWSVTAELASVVFRGD